MEKRFNLEHHLNKLYSFFRTQFRCFSLPGTSSSLRQNNSVVLIYTGDQQSVYLAQVIQLNLREAQVHSTFTYSTIINYLLHARHCSRHSEHTINERYKVVRLVMEILAVKAIKNKKLPYTNKFYKDTENVVNVIVIGFFFFLQR